MLFILHNKLNIIIIIIIVHITHTFAHNMKLSDYCCAAAAAFIAMQKLKAKEGAIKFSYSFSALSVLTLYTWISYIEIRIQKGYCIKRGFNFQASTSLDNDIIIIPHQLLL